MAPDWFDTHMLPGADAAAWAILADAEDARWADIMRRLDDLIDRARKAGVPS